MRCWVAAAFLQKGFDHFCFTPRAFWTRGVLSSLAETSCFYPRRRRIRHVPSSLSARVLQNSCRGFTSTSAATMRFGGIGRNRQKPAVREWDEHGTAKVQQSTETTDTALREIESAISALRNDILRQYSDVFSFLPSADHRNSMVMLLGNHSAGKSTIINYLLGRAVQRTGVAPTDDGFTIIQRGDRDSEEDGPTSLSDPRYQLQDLQKFGMHFVHRFKVKTRQLPPSSNVPYGLMIVDTPGMIDTPVHVKDRTSLEGQLRGYDFLAATRWFASRCDVILLVFDPANPGTTGETLDVLTKSLAGFEHKFLLVMNKVDMFDKATDFGRSYGALCWNLSKVIEMKDIPRIYTTFIPVKTAATEELEATTPLVSSLNLAPLDSATKPIEESAAVSVEDRVAVVAMQEFVRERNEVMEELLKAPLRRLDNLITETEEGARRILLAGRVCNAILWKYRQKQMITVLASSALLGLGALILTVGGISGTTMSLAGITALAAAGSLYGCLAYLKRLESELLNDSDAIFDRLFIGREKSLDLQLRWRNIVKPELLDLASSSATAGRGVITSLPTLSLWGQKSISSILKNDIPRLRLRVAEYKNTHHIRGGKHPGSTYSGNR
ncbi:putative Dynamin family [Trypanosoma cruzi]|nr:putative Dynamin family [Trypanosoma cruzi]